MILDDTLGRLMNPIEISAARRTHLLRDTLPDGDGPAHPIVARTPQAIRESIADADAWRVRRARELV